MIEILDYKGRYLIRFNGEPNEKPSYDRLFNELIVNKEYIASKDAWAVPNFDELKNYFYLGEEEELEDIGSTMKLRPYLYQREAIKFCLDNLDALLVLPCGAGK